MMVTVSAIAPVVLSYAAAALAAPAEFEMQQRWMRSDYSGNSFYPGMLQYYYDIPCPVDSYYWAFTGPITNEIVGVFFDVGDISTGGHEPVDPAQCQSLEMIRFLDFGDYGPGYPGCFTIQFDVYCSDQQGCPIGPSLWSTEWEPVTGWSYVPVDPPLCLTSCCADPGPPPVAARILVTAKCVGTQCFYPAWGMDNISTPIDQGCQMHDVGSMPALYPRPHTGHYPTVHTGFYGVDFEYCPPIWFMDGRDRSEDGTEYGFIELAWSIHLSCTGPTDAVSPDWSAIKALYR
jgi:hypothetical protein